LKTIELSWLKSLANGWIARRREGRLPHAVLLLGPAGTGKRATAAWLAGMQLHSRGSELPVYPVTLPEHPDLHVLRPPEDKFAIGVDQVRELVREVSLTSYEGGGKVAIIEPANALTTSAANSLLKTLEEPPGDSLIILIADRVGRLPATIFSRCQRLTFNCPPVADSLTWLDRHQPGGKWQQALRAAGGAPLAAIAAHERLDDMGALSQDFSAVAEGRAAPLQVADRWAKHEPAFVLDWLCGQIQSCIYRAFHSAADAAVPAVTDSVLRRIDRRNLFCYLDMINRLRGQPAGSYNVLLTFEGLLIDWADGLVGVTASAESDTATL
jgi:DNA polymerase-3 subunit delta'